MLELIKLVFSTRNAAHLEHWNVKTGSGFHHEVLGEFYTDLVEQVDVLVEAYQALYGKIGYPEIPNREGDILQILREDLEFMSENRMDIINDVPELGNLLDNVCAVYFSAMNKLRNYQ